MAEQGAAADQREKYSHDGTLRCIACLTGPIGTEQFVLCDECANPANNGRWLPKEQQQDALIVLGIQEDADCPLHVEKTAETKAWQKRKTSRKKKDYGPLHEEELAVIIAHQCKGFFEKGSPAYRRAQLAVAKLAGRYLFNRSCSSIALSIPKVPKLTERAVAKFCEESRKRYATDYVHQPLPEEARMAIAFEMLTALYPFWVLEKKAVLQKKAA